MQSENVKTIYVGQNNMAQLKCPHCGNSRTLQVEKFKGRKDPLKLRCKCENAFQVFLEFRKSYRKKTNLTGVYTVQAREDESGTIVVHDLSKRGIKFTTISNHALFKDDDIKVVFILDDQKKSKIEKQAVVRHTADKYVACEFTGKEQNDRAFQFYFL